MKRRWVKNTNFIYENKVHKVKKHLFKAARKRFRKSFSNIPLHELDFENYSPLIEYSYNLNFW